MAIRRDQSIPRPDIEAHYLDIIQKAYYTTSPSTGLSINLKEPASEENHYIGGKVSFSRVLDFPEGVSVPGIGKVVRCGMIDYMYFGLYAITEGDGRAVEFTDLSQKAKSVLVKGISDRLFALQIAKEKKNHKSRPDAATVFAYFRECLDGIASGHDFDLDAKYFDDTFGIVALTEPELESKRVLSRRSDIERKVSALRLGSNSDYCVFSVEKDGYQALVFERIGGILHVAPWIYDCKSKALSRVTPDGLVPAGRQHVVSQTGTKKSGLSL